MSMDSHLPGEKITVLKIVIAAVLSYVIYLVVKFVNYISTINRLFGNVQCPEKHWLYGNMHLVRNWQPVYMV